MNGSGDTKHNARKHHEGSAAMDHRAKKYLAGLSKKQRSAWLQEQGYTFSKDGVLVSSKGSKNPGMKTSSRKNDREMTSSEDDDEEEEDENETSSTEDAQSPVFQKRKPKTEQKRPVSSSTSDTTETNESGASDSDDDHDKKITQEDDTDDDSSSDAESAASGDNQDGGGEQSPVQEIEEGDPQEEQQDRVGDSPNTLIRKRHTKLMHKISEEGFLTLDDMELCVWRQGEDQYQGGTQPTKTDVHQDGNQQIKSDIDASLTGKKQSDYEALDEPTAPDFGNQDNETKSGVDLINTCSDSDYLETANRALEAMNHDTDAVNPKVENYVQTAKPEQQTGTETVYPDPFGQVSTSYCSPHSAGPITHAPSQDRLDLAPKTGTAAENCECNESNFKTQEEIVYSIQQSYQKLGDDAIHFVLGKNPSPRSRVIAIPQTVVQDTALVDLSTSECRVETCDALQGTKGSELEENLNHSTTYAPLKETNEEVSDGGLETMSSEKHIVLSENKNCSRSSSSESNFKKLLSQQYGFSSVTSSPLNLSVRKPEFDDHCFDLLPQQGLNEALKSDLGAIQTNEKTTLKESTALSKDQSVVSNPSNENQGVSSGNGPPNSAESHEQTQAGLVDTNTDLKQSHEGSDHVSNDAKLETGKSPCPTFIRYDGIAEFSTKTNLENTSSDRHPPNDLSPPKVDQPRVKFKLPPSHDQETCTDMDQKMLSLREHVNKSFVKSILANGHCAKTVLEMKRQERDNYEKYEAQNRMRLEKEQKKQQAQVVVETTVTECWVTGSRIASSAASSATKKCDKTIHYPPIKAKKKCAHKFTTNDPNMPTISGHKQDERNDMHNRNSSHFAGLNQPKMTQSKFKQGPEVTQNARGKELVVTLPRLGHMSTQMPGYESNDEAGQINRPDSPEENVNQDSSCDPRKGKPQSQGAHVYQNASRIPKPASRKPDNVPDVTSGKTRTNITKGYTREDHLPSINKAADLRDSKDDNRFKPRPKIQKTSLPLLKQKPKDKITDPVAESGSSDIKMGNGNFLPKIQPEKEKESTGNRANAAVVVKNKTSNNSGASWDTKTLANKDVKAKNLKPDDKSKSSNETKNRHVSLQNKLKPTKKEAKEAPPDTKSRDKETPDSSDLYDPVQTLVKKVESEIAEKVLKKLSKLSKTDKVPEIDPDASLSEKVRAKLQVLDETSDEDEPVELPPMMTDARIGMFAYKKDTPILRKTEESAIDKMKIKFEKDLAPPYKEKGKWGQDGGIKKQQPARCYEKTYTDLRAEALARARGSVKTSGNSEKPENVKHGNVDKKTYPMSIPKKANKPGLLRNTNNNYRDNVTACVDEDTCWEDSNDSIHYNTDSSSRDCDAWDETDSLCQEYTNNCCLDDNTCLYNSNNNCLHYQCSNNCLDSINNNSLDNSNNNCLDDRCNNSCLDNSINPCLDKTNHSCIDDRCQNCLPNANNNSRTASDVDEATPRCPSPDDYSTRCDLEMMHCWSSSGLHSLAKDEKHDICVHAMQCSDSKHTKKCRIPIRIASRGSHANRNMGDDKHKAVMHCRKFPQNITVVLKNNHGVQIGEAKAPIVYTNTAAVNMSAPYFTVEIVEESPRSEESDYNPQKLPLAERVKKYQKSRPRNILSGALRGNKNRRKHSKIKRGDLSRNEEAQENPAAAPPMLDKEGDSTGNMFQGRRLLNRPCAEVKRCVNTAEPNVSICRKQPGKSREDFTKRKQGKVLDFKSSSPSQQPVKLNACKTGGCETHQEQVRECQDGTKRKIKRKFATRLASRNSPESQVHDQDQKIKLLQPVENNGLNMISRCELFSSTSTIEDGGVVHTETCIDITSTRLNTPLRQGNPTQGTTDTQRGVYRGANDGRDGTLVDITELQPSFDLNLSLNCETMQQLEITGQQRLNKHPPTKAEKSSGKDLRQENQAENTLSPCLPQVRRPRTRAGNATPKHEPYSPETCHPKSEFGLNASKTSSNSLKCDRNSPGLPGSGRRTACTRHGLQETAQTQPDTDRNSPGIKRSRENIERSLSGVDRHGTECNPPSPNTVQFSLYLVQSCPPVDQSLQLYLENEREAIETRNSSPHLDPNNSPHSVINSKMIEDLELADNTVHVQDSGQTGVKSKSEFPLRISRTNDRKSCLSHKSSRQTNEPQVSDTHSRQSPAASPSSETQSQPQKQFLQLINKKVLAKRSEVRETKSRDTPCQMEHDLPGDTESTMIVDHFQEIHTMWRDSTNRSCESRDDSDQYLETSTNNAEPKLMDQISNFDSRDDSVQNLETSTNHIEPPLVHRISNSESMLSQRTEQAARSIHCESKISGHSDQMTKSLDCESKVSGHSDQITQGVDCESNVSGHSDQTTKSINVESKMARSTSQNTKEEVCDSNVSGRTDVIANSIECQSTSARSKDQSRKDFKSKKAKPPDQTSKVVACESKLAKPRDRVSNSKTATPIENGRVSKRKPNKTDSVVVKSCASTELNQHQYTANRHSQHSHCLETKPSSEKYDKDIPIRKYPNTKDNVHGEKAINHKKIANKGHFKLTPVVAAASPSISKKIPKTKGILFEKITLTSGDSSVASVARSKRSASRCSLCSGNGQGQGDDSKTSHRTGYSRSGFNGKAVREGPSRPSGHVHIPHHRPQSPCGGTASGEIKNAGIVRSRSGRGSRTNFQETNSLSRMTFDKTESREQAVTDEEYCTQEVVRWTRRNPTPVAKGQQRKGRLTLTLPHYGDNRSAQAAPAEANQSYVYACSTEGDTSSQEENTTDSSESDVEPARSNCGKTGHFQQPCHQFEKPSLPPLSRRQLGFPHRPKVKRFY